MEDLENKMGDCSFENDIFDDIDIMPTDPDEQLWDKLTQQIIEGKVIPVIGPELLMVKDVNINRFIIEGLGRKFQIASKPNSFSEIVYAPEYKEAFRKLDKKRDQANRDKVYRDQIYGLVYQIMAKKTYPATSLLERFLSIRQFPFIITTSFAPIVEQTMRKIWKDELRVMRFNNNPTQNDDIKTGADLRKPTIYYMFGKVCEGVKNYVLTDTDMLDYVSSWLSNDNKARPKNLCNELKDKYLLMLGNNYSNWLFRFIWYSMRKPDLSHGMLAYDSLDEQLINFLERAETFTRQNTSEVIDQIISRLDKKMAENELIKFDQPEENMDVFISYSRSDRDIAEQLYESLTAQGKRVWYDKNNLTDGGNFMEEINRAIKTAKYFVPILSDNIIKEKNESHVYRNEWDTAFTVATSMGRTYIIPVAEAGFDFYKAAIPEKMQQHNAISFTREAGIDVVSDKIIHKMNED